MSPHPPSLQTILTNLLAHHGVTADRVAIETGVPKTTIINWLKGKSNRPRYYDQLLKVAIYFNLPAPQTDVLLQSAGHPTLAQLQTISNGQHRHLLAHWANNPAPFFAPHDIPHFVGRASLIAQLRTTLTTPLPHAVPTTAVLHGMAGVGKSSLATHLAHQLRPHFPDGVLWGQLNGQNSGQIATQFGRAWGEAVEKIEDNEVRWQRIKTILQGKRLFVVLDNVTHDEELRPLFDLIPPQSTVLVTTRARELHTLRWADWVHLLPFAQSEESLDLFAALLGRDYVQTHHHPLTQIAHTAEHWPLALDLLASRLRLQPSLTPSALHQALAEQAGPVVAIGDQSLLTTLALIWGGLAPLEQQLLSHIAHLPGSSFTAEAALYTLPDSPQLAQAAFDQLYQAHLLYDAPGIGRYRLHPFVREYAAAQFPRPTLLIVDYYLRHRAHQRGLQSAQEPDLEAILATFPLAQAELPALFVEGCILNHNLLQLSGHFELAADLLAAAHAIAHAQEDWRNLREITSRQGLVAERRADYQACYAFHQQALQLAQKINDPEAICGTYQNLGSVVYRLGDIAQSEIYFEQALGIALELNDAFWIVTLYQSLASVSWRLGKLDKAAELCRQGIELATQTEDWDGVAQNWSMLATIRNSQDDLAGTQACLEQAWHFAEKINDQNYLCHIHADLGDVARQLQDYGRAEHHLQTSLQMAQQFGNREEEARTLMYWTRLALDQEAYPHAIRLAHQGLALLRESGHRARTGTILRYLGLAHTKQGVLAEAEPFLTEALHIAEQLGDPSQEVEIWLNKGEWYVAKGEPALARTLFEQSVAQCQQANLPFLQARAERLLNGLQRI